MRTELFLTALLGMSCVGLVACEQQGPAEQVGEQIDEAASEAEEGLEEVGEEVEQAADEAEESEQTN